MFALSFLKLDSQEQHIELYIQFIDIRRTLHNDLYNVLHNVLYNGGGGGGGNPIFSDADFGNSKGDRYKSEKNRTKTKNDPIIPAVVCSYTLKCYIFITLIYYQCKVNKIWHF